MQSFAAVTLHLHWHKMYVFSPVLDKHRAENENDNFIFIVKNVQQLHENENENEPL